MNTVIHGYKNLIVWQKAIELVAEIYKITASFPATEQYGLISQMQRSAVSIPSNIAEGRTRGTRKDFCKFLVIAYASASELETQLFIVKELPFAQKIDFSISESLLTEILKMLNVITRKLRPEKLRS